MDQVVKSQKLACSIPEAAKQLGISENTMRQLARAENFPSFKIGTRLLISTKGLERWVEEQAMKGASL